MRFGRPRFTLPLTESTMDDVRALAASGLPSGTTVVAAEQVRGRGRAGRVWSSPSGGLWMSVLLNPTRPPDRWGILPLACGAAIADLANSLGADAGVKWPNDVLVRGRKLAGVLMEARTATPEAPAHIILGVGLNVKPDGVPSEGISFTEATMRPTTVADILDPVCRALDVRYRAFENGHDDALLAEWRQLSVTLGRDVHAAEPGIEGRAVGVDDDGALLIETRGGERVRLTAGDVRELRLA